MIRTSTPEDCALVALNVRPEDEREVRDLSGLSPMQALSIGFMSSTDCVTGITKSGAVAMMAGVVAVPGGASAVWMICTPDIQGSGREFLTDGKLWLDAMQYKHGSLRNVVDQRNTVHLKLVKRLGFALGDPIADYGPGQVSVVPITRGTDV